MVLTQIRKDSLLFRTIQATRYISLVILLKLAVQFLVQLFLLRSLAPEVFGIFAFTQMVVGFISTFASIHGYKIIVREKKRVTDVINVCFSYELAVSIFLIVIIMAFAPFISHSLNRTQIINYLRILIVTLVTTSFITSQRAILERNLNFQRANVSTLCGVVTNAITSVCLVLLGYGIWSLILAAVFGQVVEALMLWKMLPFRPRISFDKKILLGAWKFGLPLTLSAVVTFAYSNIDKFMIANMLGDTQLGYYWFAFSVSNFIVLLQASLGAAIFPAFANAENDGQLMRGFSRATKASAVLFFLPCAIILALGKPVIQFMFGEKWLPALLPFKICTLLAVARAIVISHWSSVIMVRGRTSVIFCIALFYFFMISTFGYLVIHRYAIAGMATVVLVTILSSIPILKFTLRNTLRYSYIRILKPQFFSFCVTVIFGFLLLNLATKSVTLFSLSLLLTVCCYSASSYFMDREMFMWFKGAFKSLISESAYRVKG